MAKPKLVRPDDERQMTLMEHLEELRRVLIVSMTAWAVATVIGFIISGFVLGLVLGPVKAVIGPGKPLYFTGPIDKFFLYFKVGVATGFILASPIILWQVWTFIAPGLRRNERKFAVGFVGSAVLLFALGIGFAFFAMPIALRFLVNFGTSDLQYLPLADRYINFVLILVIVFGVTFELPLAMTMMGLAGIVSAKFLSRNRFKFWLGIFAGANIVTPGVDPFTPALLTAPLIVLFEISILVIRALRR
ncbi:MAG: twin-arginine translocase subunit TatC [Candidatus Dormibacteraeota bacterium]|nr:twin-arginine translocase subunit TatC [Candidatus Dormibacteraeota bacterium]